MSVSSTSSSASISSQKYEIIDDSSITFSTQNRPIGRGSFGIVIQVQYKNYPAALKIIDSTISDKDVTKEATMLSNLIHENIIRLFAVYKTREEIGLLLELMPGGSLDKLLHKNKQIKYYADHAIGWAYQCICAMSFIHSKNLLHRDIKPSNMLLSDSFIHLKLCDFGTAVNYKNTMTINCGSLAYMSPEILSEQKYNHKCDIYSFGISLWEIITRKFPYDNYERTLMLTPSSLLDKKLDRIKGIPESLMDLIESCWNEDPEKRPESDEVKGILEIIMELCGNRFKPLIDTSEHPVYAFKLKRKTADTQAQKNVYDNPYENNDTRASASRLNYRRVNTSNASADVNSSQEPTNSNAGLSASSSNEPEIIYPKPKKSFFNFS